MAKLSDILPFQGEKGSIGDTGETGDTGSRATTTDDGLIAVWAGTLVTIPEGWALCDGNNGTPDLRDKFIKGAPASTDPGGTGGNATHNHDTHGSQSHSGAAVSDHSIMTHSGAAVADHAGVNGTFVAGANVFLGVTGANLYPHPHTVTQANQHAADTHTVSAQPSDHASQSHVATDNLPAYYAVAFIMYVGI